MAPLDDHGLDLLFRSARTFSAWTDKPLPAEVFEKLYALVRLAPTSLNSSPARFVFVASPSGKERLKPHLSSTNAEKTMAAPCCVIVAYDKHFYEKLPELVPYMNIQPLFESNPELASSTAFRNSALQGAYLIMGARALGLDCGPMSGFDQAGLDGEFFPDGRWASNFLINLGFGDPAKSRPRLPRLEFQEACRLE